MEENNQAINQESFNQHKYDINIIDIYFKLVEKLKLNGEDKDSSIITDRYKNIIKYLIELKGHKSEIFFEQNLPYTLYCNDNSYDFFFALKLITIEEYLIEPLLNFQYQYSPNKDLFVNRLEFYVIENIESTKYFDNTKIKENVINWIVKMRTGHNISYTNESNPLHLSPALKKGKIKNPYEYPIHIGDIGIKENTLFKLFKTELYFDTFLKKLIELKIIDNKCKWIDKNQISKVIVNFLSIISIDILYHKEKILIARAIIEFFNLEYSVESARKYYKNTEENEHIYNSLKKAMKELTIEKEK